MSNVWYTESSCKKKYISGYMTKILFYITPYFKGVLALYQKKLKKIKDFTFVLFFRKYMTKLCPLNPEKHNLCNYYVKCFFFKILFGQKCISAVDVHFSLYIYIVFSSG